NILAPDVLKTEFSDHDFILWVKNFLYKHPRSKNKKIVKILMNQNVSDGLCSGLGNYMVAEILYRSKLSPHRSIISLSNEDIMTLSQNIKIMTKTCYMSNKTGYMKKFKNFIDLHRKMVDSGQYPNYHPDIDYNDFSFMVYRQKYDPLGNEVKSEEIILGRTTYWVPAVQH